MARAEVRPPVGIRRPASVPARSDRARRAAAALVAVATALATAGCCTSRPDIVWFRFDTPPAAYLALRGAVLAEKPDLVYDSLSEAFKSDFGLTGLRDFRAGYAALKQNHAAEYSGLMQMFDRAKMDPDKILYGIDPARGTRYAKLTVSAGGISGTIVLVEVNVVRLTIDIPGYGPTTADYFVPGRDFSGNPAVSLSLQDGRVVASVRDEAGAASPADVVEVRFHHQWLLRDIRDFPVDVHALLSGMGRTPGP